MNQNENKKLWRLVINMTLLFALVFAGVFRMQLMGYEMLGGSDGWKIYKKVSDVCATALDFVWSDGETDYYLPCISEDDYVVVKWFDSYSLSEALDAGVITIDTVMKYTPVFPWEPEE